MQPQNGKKQAHVERQVLLPRVGMDESLIVRQRCDQQRRTRCKAVCEKRAGTATGSVVSRQARGVIVSRRQVRKPEGRCEASRNIVSNERVERGRLNRTGRSSGLPSLRVHAIRYRKCDRGGRKKQSSYSHSISISLEREG